MSYNNLYALKISFSFKDKKLSFKNVLISYLSKLISVCSNILVSRDRAYAFKE